MILDTPFRKMSAFGDHYTCRMDLEMTDLVEVEEDHDHMILNLRSTAMPPRDCRAHSEVRSWDPQPRMRLPSKTPNFAKQHPGVQERVHPQILRLREPRMVTVDRGPLPVIGHRPDQGQFREK